MITANELAALHAELIGEGTICEFIASLGDKSPDDYRHDPEEDRIVQLGEPRICEGENGETFERPRRERELSGEMLEALANMIRLLAGDA